MASEIVVRSTLTWKPITKLERLKYARENFQDAGVIFNRGHILGLRNAAKNLLKPDYQVALSRGRMAVLDITTNSSASKIFKYVNAKVAKSIPVLIDIVY